MSLPRRRWWLSGLVVAALLLVGWATSTGGLGPPAGVFRPVTRGDLVMEVEVTGTLKAVESEIVGPPPIPQMWSFKISFMAPEGALVRPGMPVLAFDTSELEETLRSKLAERDSAAKELEKKGTDALRERRSTELQLAEAEARLRKAELKVDLPPELTSANELHEQRIELDVARQQVVHLRRKLELLERRNGAEIAALEEKRDRAAGRVEEIREQIGKMRVTAPREGTVIYAEWGQDKFKPGDQAYRGTEVLRIPDLSRMKAEAEIDEADAGRVAVGQRARLRLDAHPDVELVGTVSRLHQSVQRRTRSRGSKVVRLEIALDASHLEILRPEMRLRGVVEVERYPDVLLAPAQGVESTADGAIAYRRSLLGVDEVRPQIGLRNDAYVEILAGLEEGDEIRVGGS